MDDKSIKICADAIKGIVEEYGYSVLKKEKVFLSLFCDFVPNSLVGKEVIQNSIKAPVLNQIIAAKSSDDSSRVFEIKKLENILLNSYGMSVNWAHSIVEIYSRAFDWSYTATASSIHDQAPEKTDLPKERIIFPEKSRLKINDIQTFSYDAESFSASLKTAGPVFLKGDAKFIGIMVSYENPMRETELSLKWQIFNYDGSAFTDEIIVKNKVDPNDCSYYHSWGWESPGNWPVGKYRIIASINDSENFETEFEVLRGN